MGTLTASSIYAGNLLARREIRSLEAINRELSRLYVGPAAECSYDYVNAAACIRQYGDFFFSGLSDPKHAFRETLRNYVFLGGVGWPDLLPAGRRVVLRSLSPNERQCFDIAGLSDGTDFDIVSWWDDCAAFVRSRRASGMENDGREAERRSLEKEFLLLRDSTLNPQWIAIEDNGFGCDIQTFRPGSEGWGNARAHFIEVKSTLGQSRFFVSRNEWRFARRHQDSWELHFWNLRESRLKIFAYGDLVAHFPADQGTGEWVSAMISVEVSDAEGV